MSATEMKEYNQWV